MSEFEFLFTGISIVLALAIARLLEGLRDSFDPTRRFWIHYLWVVNRLMIALAIFWSLFDDRARTDMTFVSFLSLVTPPSILFLQASALVTAHPEKVSDWSARRGREPAIDDRDPVRGNLERLGNSGLPREAHPVGTGPGSECSSRKGGELGRTG